MKYVPAVYDRCPWQNISDWSCPTLSYMPVVTIPVCVSEVNYLQRSSDPRWLIVVDVPVAYILQAVPSNSVPSVILVRCLAVLGLIALPYTALLLSNFYTSTDVYKTGLFSSYRFVTWISSVPHFISVHESLHSLTHFPVSISRHPLGVCLSAEFVCLSVCRWTSFCV